MALTNIKLVVVGDGAVGKSCLLIAHTTNSFPSEYVPTVFDNYSANVTVKGKLYSIALWDTAGQEDYDRLRPLSYPQTDIFLVCYSVANRCSFMNIETKWFEELNHFCPNVPKLVVACKTDLRDTSPRKEEMTTYEEGLALAKSLKASFCETSSLRLEGLTQCFELAVELVSLNSENVKKPSRLFSAGFLSKKSNEPVLIPPVMPPAGKAPWIEIETSTFGDDWYSALQDPKFHDVTFVVEGERHLHAHKIVLCTSSSFFSKVIAGDVCGSKTQEQELNSIDGFNREDLNSGKIEGISAVYNKEESGKQQVVVELSADIQAKTFVRVLEFLYTGVPRLPDDVEEAELEELKRVADIFKLPYLETICTNVINEEEFLNPSIGTYLNDDTGFKMKKMFFNKESAQPDVVFNIEGSKVYAHKIVLSSRSQVMAAMFSGNFKEGSCLSEINIGGVTLENFLALLEYLYTDHAPIEQMSDIVDLLSLADEKGVHRLVNLCELYISKEVERVCERQIEKADIDVIGLLNTSRIFNAQQMVDWCLHFISTNYVPFSKRTEFSNLAPEDRSYVDEHRWPPLSYLEEVEEFEKKMEKRDGGGGGSKCSLM